MTGTHLREAVLLAANDNMAFPTWTLYHRELISPKRGYIRYYG